MRRADVGIGPYKSLVKNEVIVGRGLAPAAFA